MIKVCHIASGDLWAGAEVMIHQLLRYLATEKKVSLSAIILNEGRLSAQLRSLHVPIEIIDETKIPFLQIVRRVNRILQRDKIDIIHSHRYKENIVAYLASRHRPGTRILTTQHGMVELPKRRSVSNRILQLVNLYLCRSVFDGVVAVSHDIQATMISRFRFVRTKTHVIHNGIPVPEFPITRNDGIFVIGSAGRLCPIKNYELMIAIADQLRNEKSIRFMLAGDGPERGRLEQLVHALRLDHTFYFLGHLPDVSPLLAHLHLYLNTSLHEGIPISVLEAMGSGLPVLAPRVGGLREIVDDEHDGFLVESHDPTRFAECIRRLLADSRKRLSMAEAARLKVLEKFSIASCAQRYYDLYQSLSEGLNTSAELTLGQ